MFGLHMSYRVEGDRGITRKMPKSWSNTRHTEGFFAMQKQHWWDANTETMHQQLLQLIAAVQER